MVWITGTHVYDVSVGRFQDLDVAVSGDRIAGMTARGRPGPDQEVLDLSGAFLLPGLIDCHVHLTIRSEDADPGATAARSEGEIARYARMAGERTVRAGITSVRDLGGWNYLEMALRDEVVAGRAVGPRMFLAGRLLSIPTPATDYYPGMYEVVRGSIGVAEGVRRQMDHGADVIKVMATGAMLSPEDEDAGAVQLTREELREAVEAAEVHDVPVAAHAHAGDGIDSAVDAGVASIEHGTFADDAVLRKMADRGTFLVPTSCAFAGSLLDAEMRTAMPDHVLARFEDNEEIHRRMVRRAHELGVPIAMGTDAGTPGNHHGSNALESVLLVRESGLTPAESLKASTQNPAMLLRRPAELGVIGENALADLIACRGNPLDDITELQRVAFVMLGGRVVRDDLTT
jgi:imidazolonepropionase-like amidohydrolase